MPKTKTSTSTSTTKTLDDFLSSSYPYELVREEDGTFFASHPDLLGCFAQGNTPEEAINALDDARQAWISVRFEDGLEIPFPIDEGTFSGKFLLRMSPSIHAALSKIAQRQGLSLNQLINNALAEYIGGTRKESEVAALLDAIADLKVILSRPNTWRLSLPRGEYHMRLAPTATGETGAVFSRPAGLLSSGEMRVSND